ncbi:hypothetical protein [Fimbriimonas ginsengisoli]|uniref:hypothetical protein n=1 Tax=Fimbriimonas ginsengisoli TaxID=1005039 RepID=UPI00046CD44C|nr:hypothetical protein [Fimbriimonas ginsengisoli]
MEPGSEYKAKRNRTFAQPPTEVERFLVDEILHLEKSERNITWVAVAIALILIAFAAAIIRIAFLTMDLVAAGQNDTVSWTSFLSKAGPGALLISLLTLALTVGLKILHVPTAVAISKTSHKASLLKAYLLICLSRTEGRATDLTQLMKLLEEFGRFEGVDATFSRNPMPISLSKGQRQDHKSEGVDVPGRSVEADELGPVE